MEILTTIAKEKSTFILTVAFTDENGSAVAPETLKWSLTDENGTAINSRTDVSVASPQASNSIVLSGDDLQILEDEANDRYAKRRFVAEATYDSDLGNDLPVNDAVAFVVENLAKIT